MRFPFSTTLFSTMILVLASGCASLKFDPQVYRQKKLALITVYGQKMPNMIGFSALGSVQSADAEWGTKTIQQTQDKIVAEFHQATGASVIPPKSAVATGSYRGLASVFGASTYTTVDGMIPADLSPEHDAQFARLAKDLKVDAVILMANSYTLNRDDGSIQTTAMDRYEVAIVGSDGKRLWHEKDMVETRPSEASAAGLGSSIVGMIPKEEAESLLREVTLKAVQNFSSHFSQKRGG